MKPEFPQKSPESKKGFRNIFALGFVSFFTDFSTELIYPLLPLFLANVLHSSNSFIGLIEGIAISTASIIRVFSGFFSDRIKNRKLFAIIGYSISNITKPLTGFATRSFHVLLLRFIDRTGKGIRTAPRDALIAESVDKKKYGISYGFHRAMDTLGATLAPLSAFFLLKLFKGDFRKVFFFSLIPGIIAVVVLVLFVKEIKRKKKEDKKIILSTKFPFSYYMLILAMAIFTLGNSSDAFLILRLNHFVQNVTLIPLLWFGFNLVYSLVSIPAGYIADRWSKKGMIIIGLLIYFFVYLGFSMELGKTFIILLFLSYGIFYGIVEGNVKAYLAHIVPSEKKATAFGLYHTVVGFLSFPASLIFGILWDKFGASLPFKFGAFLSLIAAFIFLFNKEKIAVKK